ncbi:DUF1000-domain-containing protein [Pluteus cervinus]|uniref:DUF1000-domain-containing protein n=1 Tax=Pluteus cervinus TaxID=181527 RepID=A0ACD3AKM1_9AGAR|nr:DUF1000-domain-containing protein [Pluteus cervinus]
MDHRHNSSCGHENHDHDHDHDHDQPSEGPQDNLYAYIDRKNVVALNTVQVGSDVIKPWHERMEETRFIQSDADDQVIVRVPFAGSVRLRSIVIKAGPMDETPSKVSLFANNPSLDFDDISDQTSSQELEIAQGREPFEYPIKPAKFSNVSSITLYFPSSQGAESTKIYYIGFLGHHFERKSNPIITVYETQANLADHPKIQGTDGNFNTPST